MAEENTKDFLSVAEKAAREAGKIILEFQKAGLKVSSKSDGTDVTNADIESEKKIIEIIKSGYPTHRIYGEESGVSNNDSKSDYLWAIDPIDGTSAYLNQESTACVNISLLRKNKSVIGVIYNPFTNELFKSGNGKSELNGKKLPLLKQDGKKTTLNYHLSKRGIKDANILLNLWTDGDITKLMDQGGSPSYNLALVSKGSHTHFIMDCYKDPSPEDYSAAVFLVRNSGGIVTNLEGNNIDPLTHKGYMVASSDKKLHGQLLELLKTHEFGKKTHSGKMILIGGFYGTGKSTLAIKLQKEFGNERLNSDIIRRKMEIANYKIDDADFIWGAIHFKIAQALQEGKNVIVEAAYLDESQRLPEYDIARSKDADVMLIEVICPEEITKKRISSRPTSPDGIHVPTNRIEFYDKKKDLWEPVIPGLKKINRKNISYLIYDSNKEKLYPGLIREGHKDWANEIANCLGVSLSPQNSSVINSKKRYEIK